MRSRLDFHLLHDAQILMQRGFSWDTMDARLPQCRKTTRMNIDVLRMLQFAIVAGGMLMVALWALYFFWIRPAIRRNQQSALAHMDQRNLNKALGEATEPNAHSSYQFAAMRQARLAAAMLGLETRSDLQWALAIRQGFPAKALDSLSHQSGLTKVELGQILGISPEKSVHQDQRKALSHTESEHLLRLATVLALAADTLGDMTAAISWMRSPHPELNNVSPLSLLDTAPGAQSVRRVLASISYGILSQA